MNIWKYWWELIKPLRKACTRERTFMWLVTALIGFSVRDDLLGVSSFIRALGLMPACYGNLLDFFHSSGITVSLLTTEWVNIVLSSGVEPVRTNGRLTLLLDGIKTGKEGRKMPGVKLLHQESDSNTKPEYIMGHSLQAVSLLVHGAKTVFAVPLASRLHEGYKFTNRDKRTLLDKAVELLDELGISEPVTLVVDAYYASGKVAKAIYSRGCHLVTRVKTNAVAWIPAVQPEKRSKGRPKIYEKKVQLRSLFENIELFEDEESPYVGEKAISILVKSIDLLWRPTGTLVRFVAVVHPTRGKILLMSTDLTMSPLEIIKTYSLRFKIELSFKQSLHVIGVYLYHFWMMPMEKIKRGSGTQYLHHKSEEYRDAVRRKVDAYHRFIQIGLIAQGIMQILACKYPLLVWHGFGSWLRTMNVSVSPSEFVTSKSLRNTLVDFLGDCSYGANYKKFIWERIDLSRSDGLKLTG